MKSLCTSSKEPFWLVSCSLLHTYTILYTHCITHSECILLTRRTHTHCNTLPHTAKHCMTQELKVGGPICILPGVCNAAEYSASRGV